MLNTIFGAFAAKKNTVPVLYVESARRPIFDKYFKYFIENSYSEDEAKLIANIFQDSADDADIYEDINIQKLQETNYLSLCCSGTVGLYACPFGTKHNHLVCRLSLETALHLAETLEISWERTSRHFLEYYLLA